jgi:tetratricopeptide (TPR) repeat protein
MQPLEYENRDPLSHIVEFLGKVDEEGVAKQLLDVFARYSNNLEQFNLLAKLYLDIRSNQEAEELALRTLSLCTNPQEKYAARANLAKMYNNLNYPEKSLVYAEQNLAQSPHDPETQLEMVFALYLMNRKQEAEQILINLKKREHTFDERLRTIIDFNMGTYDMINGKFLEGLKGFLFNVKKLKIWFSPRELPYRAWTGGAYPGRTLIMFMEGGGIGDDFITIRFYKDLKEMGFHPIFYTSKTDVCKIFNECGYDSVTSIDHVPSDSMWCYAMHVPIHLGVKPEDVERSRYLWASDSAIKKWSWVAEGREIRVGVRWQGNSKNERSLHREVPLPDIMNMLHTTFDGIPVKYYSLQVGDGEEQADAYPELIQVQDQIKSFDDTFALIEHLDCVVTSCTSVLHASAILGKPTYGLIPISSYFTWISPAPPHRSIWYPDNLKLFQQQTPRVWEEPLSDLSAHLKRDLGLCP